MRQFPVERTTETLKSSLIANNTRAETRLIRLKYRCDKCIADITMSWLLVLLIQEALVSNPGTEKIISMVASLTRVHAVPVSNFGYEVD